jgi:RNA polymerase sigma-70 factor (ECF subfamily)
VNIEALLERIAEGDKAAFSGVVEHFQRPLFGYLGRLGLSQGPAEEIAQETFWRAWTRLSDYDPARAAFSTWLFTIARNFALNELARAAGKHEVTTFETLPEIACIAEPAQALMDAQRRQRVHAALRALPLTDRSALALVYFKELDLASIARIEGCTVAAIKVRLHRARERLRELLEDDDG